MGVGVDSLKRIVAGEVNEVYDTKTKDGNFIVRISRGEENRFLTEKWALNAARDVGVPTPQMFFIDEFENKLKGFGDNTKFQLIVFANGDKGYSS